MRGRQRAVMAQGDIRQPRNRPTAAPEMPWSTPFDDPIALPGGGRLATLQQAADYIMKLPQEVQQQARWQTAIENLINAAEAGGGWLMFARIGVMRALNGDG